MDVNKDKIRILIMETEEAIANSPYTLEESLDAQNRMREWIKTDDQEVSEVQKKIDMFASAKATNTAFLERLQSTLEAELMKVDTKYVITDTKALISPAGYGASDRVFVQTNVAIHTDDINADVPSCNVPLYRHTLQTYH